MKDRENPSQGSHDLTTKIIAHLAVVDGPDSKGDYITWCPFHPDGKGKPPHRPNLKISVRGFVCFACGEKGSLRKLAHFLGVNFEMTATNLERVYDYHDESGKLLFQVVRKAEKKFSQRRPDGKNRWIWSLKGVRRVLYRLPEIIGSPEATVYVVEGEKDADRLIREGLVATTNSGGAGKWREEYCESLAGRDVVILPDNDGVGKDHAETVAASVKGHARTVRVLFLPGLGEKQDVSDWLDNGHDADKLEALERRTPLWRPSSGADQGNIPLIKKTTSEQSFALRIVNLVSAEAAELFRDELGEPYAHVEVDDHRDILPINSRSFKQWIAGRFWRTEKTAPSSEALNSALNVIGSIARFEGNEHSLHNRVAFHENAIWYDLGDARRRAIKITAQGWDIVSKPPILFRHYSHQKAQVEPIPGGELRELQRFINVRDDSQFLLLASYLIGCFIPGIPHPILVLHGPQGSAKTTLSSMLRRLVDPSAAEILSFPRNPSEFAQQLSHHWNPVYDNISAMHDWISDMLCRAVTGEGFSKRSLYTNDEDYIYTFKRSLILNGINIAAQKADLLDRCILFELEPISPAERRPEKELWEEFEKARGRLFGSALCVLSHAMALYPSVEAPALPRMADFARWGCAISGALGSPQQDFLKTLDRNARTRNEEALSGDPLGPALLSFMEEQGTWEGPASELLNELNQVARSQQIDTQAKIWPKAAHILSRRVKGLRTNLAAAGIQLEATRSGSARNIVLRKISDAPLRRATHGTNPGEMPDIEPLPDDALAGEAQEPSREASHSKCLILNENDANDACDATLPTLSPEQVLAAWPEERKEALAERVAFMIIDGGMSESQARERAFRDAFKTMQTN